MILHYTRDVHKIQRYDIMCISRICIVLSFGKRARSIQNIVKSYAVILSMYIQNLCNFQRFPPVAWSIYTHVQIYHRVEELTSRIDDGGLSVVK